MCCSIPETVKGNVRIWVGDIVVTKPETGTGGVLIRVGVIRITKHNVIEENHTFFKFTPFLKTQFLKTQFFKKDIGFYQKLSF